MTKPAEWPLPPPNDGLASYQVGIDAIREALIRKRQVSPRQDDPEETRWAEEGPRDWPELDTVRKPR